MKRCCFPSGIMSGDCSACFSSHVNWLAFFLCAYGSDLRLLERFLKGTSILGIFFICGLLFGFERIFFPLGFKVEYSRWNIGKYTGGISKTQGFSSMNRAFNRKKDKSWMHTPDALAKHYIPYNAKFLGNTEVDQPKGTEIVKEAVRKLKFQRHIKKSEGQKTQKVELQISIYGVKILDPKTKDVQYNCQLHRISFCADDKTDKRIFTFICKDSESNKHLCYVFDSEKCIQELETENSGLKKQLWELEEQLMIAPVPPQLHINSTNEAYMLSRPSSLFWCHNLMSFSCLEISSVTLTPMSSPESNLSAGLLTPPPAKSALLPKPADGCSIPRPRAGSISLKPPMSTDVFDMVPFSAVTPLVPIPASNGTPPPPTTTSPPDMSKDLFGAEPFDPFTCGQADFPPDIQSRLDEMQEGFKMGLTLEATVFSLEPLGGRC
ncbi:PTB domain-containing engulfment adapter protein 1-like isoform X3 [Oncorhynchus kisutch]|uniref:PTB domain-containing engulfment adapter protein 1-like isoform X3 n=1 Tax=Oncorhynchus kisutch TaxID=8019 RepID=UPI0012DE680A|nr:PTB domain-containing engulfment adapter protein 1-like isoform X3 [Oncorhynchus kisutch]